MNIRFSPSLLTSFATIFGISLFVHLGLWQLERANEKERYLEQSAQNELKPIISLPHHIGKQAESLRNRQVFFHGQALSDRQFLLDNQIRNGRAGVNVITPFLRDDHSIVLLDRGWIEFSRDQLPDVSLPTQSRRIEGRVYVATEPAFALDAMDAGQTSWPRLITHIDPTAIEERLGLPLVPVIVRLSKDDAHGYLRQWPEVARLDPNVNTSYAIQWFALAATVLILFISLNLKRVSRRQ